MGEEEKTPNTVNEQNGAGAQNESTSSDEIMKMLEEIKKSSDLQVKYAKKQAHRSFITALACFLMMLAVCAAVLIMLPRVNDVFNDVNAIMDDMKVVTAELAGADYEGMFEGIQDLIVEGSISLGEAMEKIEDIDIEGLNRAIKNLSDAIQPFAAFFGRGR